MKRNFIKTLVIFAALALTACGQKPTSQADESKPAGDVSVSEPAEKTSSNHKHKYGSWTVTKEATCETAGEVVMPQRPKKLKPTTFGAKQHQLQVLMVKSITISLHAPFVAQRRLNLPLNKHLVNQSSMAL